MQFPLLRYRRLLSTYLRPQRAWVFGLAGLVFGGIGVQLLNPQLMRNFLDAALAAQPLAQLITLAMLFMSLAFGQQLLALAAVYLSENIGWTATNALRADLVAHCLRLDSRFHAEKTPGELIERIDGDITSLANFFSQFIIQLLGNGLLLLGIIVLLALEDWRVALGLIVCVAAGIGLLQKMQRVGVPRWGESRQASAELFGFLEERLAATEDIRASGARNYVLQQLYRHMHKLYHKTRSAELATAWLYNAGQSMFILASGLGLGIGIYLYQQQQTTLGGVYLITAYIGLLTTPLDQILRQIQEFQKASASIIRIDALRQEQPTIIDGTTATLPQQALDVQFDQVLFGYSADAPILHALSFELPAGQILGVLGRTGSGKSSLIRLLLRLYDPQQGSIRLGGTDIRNTSLSTLRRSIGFVTQDVQLFQASVRENLRLFDQAIADQSLLDSVATLGLTPWLQSLEHGLDTIIQPNGLSAGQAQLLAFGRILLKNPRLIILDEASSRLDPASEVIVERALDRLLAGRTTIIIAHRLASLQRADKILVLEHGRIREFGSRQALLQNPQSQYRQLVQHGITEVWQ
ncbi:ABC transporter ATP-binding protein [Herpetosiphon sp. NSE202]|uniref:ABC transporter ATP-binding protein n=1 Tax=Herpetosiphon sp. NSE202 TaxID=3351349 RepID=UPI0036438317